MPVPVFRSGGPSPESFQKAMVFIDGTNLFHRLKSARLKFLKSINSLFPSGVHFVRGRQVARIYLYTIKPHFEEAQGVHGQDFFIGTRVQFGDAVQRKNGIAEKCVDALLVADMIYHAASRNCEYVLLVSTDTDFRYALRRVEDFGCRSAVLSVCAKTPDRLREACDDCFEIEPDWLVQKGYATRIP
jgi:uncharacterized LabA/DUF88 family protein